MECQLCTTVYIRLFDLVSHVRAVHSAEMNLSYVCRVDRCPRVFKKTNTWYKHVLKCHFQEYYSKTISRSEEVFDNFDGSDDDEEIDMDIVSPEGSDTDPPTSSIHNVSEEVLAGKLLKIREKNLVCQDAISEIVELVESIFDETVSKCLSASWELGKEAGMDTTSLFFHQLPQRLEGLSSPLSSIATAFKQQSFIAKNLIYVKLVWHEIGTHVGYAGRSQIPTNVTDGFYYVPFLQSIEALLNNSSIFDQVMSGSHLSDGEVLRDICDGTVWENESHTDPILQIICYYDELCLTNPLMSKSTKHKIGAVYFMLGNLDPALRSRLEAINLVALFNSSLLSKYSLNEVLRPFVDDVKQLNSPGGWPVTIAGKHYHVTGKLVAFVGDTPAVNMAGGFKEGVGMAMRKCRQCMATYSQIQVKFAESEFQMRRKEEDARQCALISLPSLSESEKTHYSKVYGINRSTVLMELPYFDVTRQLPQDLMHVLLEGVFPLHLEQLVGYIIIQAY